MQSQPMFGNASSSEIAERLLNLHIPDGARLTREAPHVASLRQQYQASVIEVCQDAGLCHDVQIALLAVSGAQRQCPLRSARAWEIYCHLTNGRICTEQ